MRFFILILFILHSNFLFCQNSKINIQYITLKNKIIEKEIEEIVDKEIENDKTNGFFKKGLGYINLYMENYVHGDTLAKCYVEPSMYSLKKGDENAKYPIFYTYINGRIVLIYINILQNFINPIFSERSKSKIRRKLNYFLEKTTDQTFYDDSGKKAFRDKNFRIDYFKFDSGKYFYLTKDELY